VTQVLLLGASGYTGRLVAEELIAERVAFTAVTRDAARLEDARATLESAGVGVLELDVQDAAALARLITPDHLVINCAGPFQLHARDVVTAIANAGATYIDICGEASFVAWCQAELNDVAQRSGALLVHACAFESLPADMLARLLCEAALAYVDISSYYIAPAGATSPGTLLSMRLVSQATQYVYEEGEFVAQAPGTVVGEVELPFAGEARSAAFAPYPELRFWPRRYATRSAASYLLLRDMEAALMRRRSPPRARPIEELLAQHQRQARPAADAQKRRTHAFSIGVVARREDGAGDVAWLTGVDPYGFTASIAAWSCGQLLHRLASGPLSATGVVGPGDVFDPGLFLRAAAAWPCRLTLNRAPLSPSP
jgi:putative NADH-flavin reductase